MEMEIPSHILDAVEINDPEIARDSKSLRPIAVLNTNNASNNRPLIRRWASHDPNSSVEDLFHASDSDHDNDYQTDITSPQVSDTDDMQEEVEDFREREYPQLKGKVYLDHGGTTLYCKSLMDAVHNDLTTNLYGNPHSASAPSAIAGHRVDAVRERALRFFGADPEHWDIVFVANATAALKLVMECFKDHAAVTNTPVWYGYHKDSHTSVVGVRRHAKMSRCFRSDDEVENWIKSGGFGGARSRQLGLFAYPGQSNFSGRRLPTSWPGRIRKQFHKATTYTLLDAAALASTGQIDLSDLASAPDFVAMSFYKIFGYPHVGALLVQKQSAHVLQNRKYFGGGTVDMVVALDDEWQVPKERTLHDRLEDGTVPFLHLIALDHAITAHERLYGPKPMKYISQHTAQLGKMLYEGLSSLQHSNGLPVCHIYKDDDVIYGDPTKVGATVAFNVMKPGGGYHGYEDVEKAANLRDIFVRSGSLCNPGGMASYLKWSSAEMASALSTGHSCSSPIQVFLSRPTGVIRASLGAMSTARDVTSLLNFLDELYVEKAPQSRQTTNLQSPASVPNMRRTSDTRTPSMTLTPASQKLPPLSVPFVATVEGEHAAHVRSPMVTSHPEITPVNEPQEKPRFIPEDYTKRYRPWEDEIRKAASYANASHDVKVRELEDDNSALARSGTPSVKARKFGRSVVSLLRSKSHAQDVHIRPPIPTSPLPNGHGQNKNPSNHSNRSRKSFERSNFQHNVESLGM